jgi:hypothetical protein
MKWFFDQEIKSEADYVSIPCKVSGREKVKIRIGI